MSTAVPAGKQANAANGTASQAKESEATAPADVALSAAEAEVPSVVAMPDDREKPQAPVSGQVNGFVCRVCTCVRACVRAWGGPACVRAGGRAGGRADGRVGGWVGGVACYM